MSRLPTRHIGKALTAALRRGESDPLAMKARINVPSAQSAMQEAEARFAAQGRLAATPASQSASVARQERACELEGVASQQAASRSTVRPAGGVSPAAYLLGRLGRMGKAQGVDAKLLNEESKLIEEWLAAQEEVAKAALDSLASVPGLRLEPELQSAIETARRRRVGVYGTKHFFFEDTEVLSSAIEEYARAVRQPHDVRMRLWRAQCHVSECEGDTSAAGLVKMQGARRSLAKAKQRASRAASIASDRRIDEARAVMVAAAQALERDYYITPLDRVKTTPPDSDLSGIKGAERKSNSNQIALKPRPRPHA